LIPARLIADEWRSQTGDDVLLVSTASPDHPFLREVDHPYHQIEFHPWVGQGFRKLIGAFDLATSYPGIRDRLSQTSAVLGFGGYSSVPLLIAAKELGIPIFLQEQNRIMGRANTLFQDSSLHVFFGLPPKNRQFSTRFSVIGNPVRRAGTELDEWFSNGPLLLVFGGSQGSYELSEYLREYAENFLENSWSIYYVKGDHGQTLSNHEFADHAGFREVSFEEQLPSVYPHVTCAWVRAGAGTISELIRFNVPGLLFPYQPAADNHQFENARWLANQGPAKLVDSSNSAVDLYKLTRELSESSCNYSVHWNRDSSPRKQITRNILKWV